MSRTTIWGMAAGGALALGVLGCAHDDSECKTPASREESAAVAANAGTVNGICPVGGHAVDPAVTVMYKGQKVGLCCEGCRPKWVQATDADRDKMLAAVKGK